MSETNGDDLDVTDLTAQLELLEEENQRLREEVARVRQQRYRHTAFGLTAIGFLALVGGVIFPDVRAVLFALGATGFFAGVLVYYLTPDAVISADVGELVYAAMAANQAAIADTLGLADISRYIPTDDGVRLFIPHLPDADLPSEFDSPFVTESGQQGLLLTPTGGPLFEALERTSLNLPAESPAAIADLLADAATEQFELAQGVATETTDNSATFAISNSTMGDVDRFDHPLASLFAVGLASALDRPVDLEVREADDRRRDWLVVCHWEGLE